MKQKKEAESKGEKTTEQKTIPLDGNTQLIMTTDATGKPIMVPPAQKKDVKMNKRWMNVWA